MTGDQDSSAASVGAGVPQISDARALRFPVSVKGVIFIGEEVVLLRNERDEWELPGGKLDPGEDPMGCLVREIREELNLEIEVRAILDCWVYDILGQVEVLIVTYLCSTPVSPDIRISAEHKEVGRFPLAEVEGLPMPEGYKASIRRVAAWRET